MYLRRRNKGTKQKNKCKNTQNTCQRGYMTARCSGKILKFQAKRVIICVTHLQYKPAGGHSAAGAFLGKPHHPLGTARDSNTPQGERLERLEHLL